MQQIQIVTTDDVVQIVTGQLDERLKTFRGDMVSSVREILVEIIKAELPHALELVLQEELRAFRRKIVETLEDAVRAVVEERLSSRAYSDDSEFPQ